MKPKHVVTSMILLAIAVFISNAWSLTADQTSPPRTPQSDRQTLIALDLLTRAAATHVSPLVELSTPNALITCPMIYHCIRYTIDPHKLADFEIYARRNMQGGIIRRCGGDPLGYFLPKKGLGGADNIAIALIGFESLAAYEEYRKKLMEDPDQHENLAHAEQSHCILVEDRSYFYRIDGNDAGKES